MPTSIWTAEVSYDNFQYTDWPTPEFGLTPNIRNWSIGLEAICLPLLDDFPSGAPAADPAVDDGNFAIHTGVTTGTYFPISLGPWDPTPVAFQYVTMRLNVQGADPIIWQTPFILQPILTASPPLPSGTLSITKDYDGNLMTFTGPLGTQTCSLTDIDALPGGPYGYHNTTPLRPRGTLNGANAPGDSFSSSPFDINDHVEFYDLIGKENGAAYDTIHLSAADPGIWWPIDAVAQDPVTGVSVLGDDTFPWLFYNQLTSREEVTFKLDAASWPIYRDFRTLRRRMSVSNAASDMIQVRAHGPFFATVIYSADPSTVKVRKTHDNGTIWLETTLYSGVGTINKDPGIAWSNGRLYGAWGQSGSVIQSSSNDFGVSWSAPVTLFTGTNPRLVVDPRPGGAAFYFYINGSGTLLLTRSGNFGVDLIDATPITVATGVGQQTVTAGFAADGSILVGYILTGAWTQLRSRDYGVSWS